MLTTEIARPSEAQTPSESLHRNLYHEATWIAPRPDSKMAGGQSEQLPWTNDVVSALKSSQYEGKPVVVVFQQDNCSWCKEYDRELARPEFISSVADRANFARVNPEHNQDARSLADMLGVDSYPTAVVLNVKGGKITPIAKFTGYQGSGDLARSVDDAFNQLHSATAVSV